MSDDEKALRDYLAENYGASAAERSVASVALELLKTEAANRRRHGDMADLISSLQTAYQHLRESMEWAERVLARIEKLSK